MKESELEVKTKKLIEDAGGRFLKFTSPGMRGVPDRLALWPLASADFIEMKRPKGGRLSPLQVHRHEELRLLGFRVVVIWTIEQAKEYVEGKR